MSTLSSVSPQPSVVPAEAASVAPTAPAPPRAARILVGIFLGAFLVLLAMFIFGPLLWLGVRAFSTGWTYPNLGPDGWTLDWWTKVFSDNLLGTAITNSISFAFYTVAASCVICLPAAYAFGRYRFPGRKFFLIALFATNSFPKMGLFVTMASLFYAMNLMQKPLGIVIVHVMGTVVFMTWIPAAAFAAVPRSLEEAARDAGASPIRVFFTITLPLAMPGILVAMIMSFLASFDEAQGTYLIGAPDYLTMPTQMYTLVLNYPLQMAAVFSILLSIPSVLLLALVRKQVMGGQLAEGFQLR